MQRRCAFSEIASDALKGRVFEVSLADLQNDEVAFRKFKLISEEVQGRNVLTNFHGMDMTTDKLRSMVKKWQVSCDVLLTKISLSLHYWSYKSCKAPVKSSPPTNQHAVFYRPDALPVALPTLSKH